MRRLPVVETFADRPLNSVSDSVRRVAKVVQQDPYANSAVSDPLVFSGAGSKTFYHGLGRIPARWTLEDATVAPPAVYRQSWDEQSITITASIACTVVIRVGAD